MRWIARALLALVLVPLTAIGTGGTATALSCVLPASVLEDAEAVFTGRIVGAQDQRLRVAVDEVWEGRVAEEVWLRVDLPGWSEWSNSTGKVPDGFTSPERWLFSTELEGEFAYRTGPCSAWPADSELVAGQRPAVVRQPGSVPEPSTPTKRTRASSNDDLRTGQVLAGGAVVVLAGGVLVTARRRRRRLS